MCFIAFSPVTSESPEVYHRRSRDGCAAPEANDYVAKFIIQGLQLTEMRITLEHSGIYQHDSLHGSLYPTDRYSTRAAGRRSQ
ncbi:hypothetical protein B9D02_15780 [Pantoea vagans]|nr:hypothetical protein B9D02_15780 [Pantoea vagans]